MERGDRFFSQLRSLSSGAKAPSLTGLSNRPTRGWVGADGNACHGSSGSRTIYLRHSPDTERCFDHRLTTPRARLPPADRLADG